jgi:hypothetical protein
VVVVVVLVVVVETEALLETPSEELHMVAMVE